ncbi:hypothetical protein N0B31_11540 [Salinirubellus salinus]|uniref:Uncharacterized protein n=1 Tax=Salinirubellus salinus TaxID=1364945 RepID=A0A9E7U326_9EURY|nr:hypothetical protein [Salinirubellus salinus]UWM52785.1 hypothetical protein N0B31_11540 [Salinirubellus salinus]
MSRTTKWTGGDLARWALALRARESWWRERLARDTDPKTAANGSEAVGG